MKNTKFNKEAYLRAGFTYEEIEDIIKAEEEIKNGEVSTEEEVNNFIDNELFANYKINA